MVNAWLPPYSLRTTSPKQRQTAPIVKNNRFRPTTNTRGYGRRLTKTPDRESACRARFASFNFANAPIFISCQASFRVSPTNQSALTWAEAADAGFTAPAGFQEIERRRYDDTELIFLRAA